RVRVMDFGLARPSEMTSTLDERERSAASQRALSSTLTRTGAMVGTPAYMAPEQFEGSADARSDQFGFCVALYQSLYGQRPFAGDDLNSLLAAIDARAFTPPTTTASVPSWLREVVLRGLAAQPERRWPSMAALLEALADDPAHRRRRWRAAALIAVAITGTAGGVAWAAQRQARACADFEPLLAGVWDAEQQRRVDAALEATGLSYARETSERVRARLDDYTSRWVTARQDACEASRRGEQSGVLLDLRMRCLDERLQHVAATVDVLLAADEQVVHSAVKSVATLPSLDPCADVAALTSEQPPPEEQVAARVAALDERLIEAKALMRAGRYAPGLEVASPVVADAEAIGYEPLQARAWLTAGTLQIETAAHEQAEATLERAFDSAVALGMTAEAADAARMLVYVVGIRLARHAEGRAWAKPARPLARAAGTEKATAQLLGVLGVLATEEGDYEEAGALLERALAAHERALGPEHPGVATTLGSLVGLAGMQGRYAEARVYVERALAISERALGPNHPEVGLSLSNLGSLALVEGDLAAARAYFERALEIFEAAYGPDHPNVAATLGNLGSVAETEGRHEEAYAYSRRALAIQEALVGEDHPSLIPLLTIVGMTASAERRYDDAREHLQRALDIGERARGTDHPSLADTLTQIAQAALAQERYEEARGLFERAVASAERGLGPDHVRVSDPLLGLGRALLGLDAGGDALPHLERALTLRRDNASTSESIAVTSFALARALWDAPADGGRDRARAERLADSARVSFEAAGESQDLDDVLRWRAEHAP
ncbi:MAG: tetratricopeptide repeat protein, partial [Myxococcales bacterium]|nr:tetratricopeptide repeat protein [Myxococcales bacterium]